MTHFIRRSWWDVMTEHDVRKRKEPMLIARGFCQTISMNHRLQIAHSTSTSASFGLQPKDFILLPRTPTFPNRPETQNETPSIVDPRKFIFQRVSDRILYAQLSTSRFELPPGLRKLSINIGVSQSNVIITTQRKGCDRLISPYRPDRST